MSVPGSNLLRRAARLLKMQSVDYYQDLGRQNNAAGLDVTNYAEAVAIKGSLQAVPLHTYQELGLDFGKKYVTFFTSTPLIGIQRDVSGDLMAYGDQVYQCMSITDWIGMDGWNSVLAVLTSRSVPSIVTYVITPDPENVITP